MAAKTNFLGLDASYKVRRPPLVGMQFLHGRAAPGHDGTSMGGALQARELLTLLRQHFTGFRRPAPRCRISLRVFTPSGTAAVKISHW